VRELEVVYLHGSFELIHQRVNGRRHRFMPATLLESQFAALEPPERAISVDVSMPIGKSVSLIKARLKRD
jgi:gluconokinase